MDAHALFLFLPCSFPCSFLIPSPVLGELPGKNGEFLQNRGVIGKNRELGSVKVPRFGVFAEFGELFWLINSPF